MPPNATDRYAELILRCVFAFIALKAWSDVIFRRAKVRWKGANRAPLSMRSKVVAAIAMTALCVAGFGIYPMVGAATFAVGIIYLMFQSKRDRRAYDRLHGIPILKAPPWTDRQQWLYLCVVDTIVLLPSLFACIRDLWFPPATEEQRIVHIMGLGLLTASTLGAIALFITRRKEDSDKKDSNVSKLPG